MGVLDGKVAIITGGTSGIGARTAELFVDAGAGLLPVDEDSAHEAVSARLPLVTASCALDEAGSALDADRCILDRRRRRAPLGAGDSLQTTKA
jgi:NAD(P)-dependent dehydrogenase (short-subunit alcohol dehydrogenase family)